MITWVLFLTKYKCAEQDNKFTRNGANPERLSSYMNPALYRHDSNFKKPVSYLPDPSVSKGAFNASIINERIRKREQSSGYKNPTIEEREIPESTTSSFSDKTLAYSSTQAKINNDTENTTKEDLVEYFKTVLSKHENEKRKSKPVPIGRRLHFDEESNVCMKIKGDKDAKKPENNYDLACKEDNETFPRLEDNTINTAHEEINVAQESDERVFPRLDDSTNYTVFETLTLTQELDEKAPFGLENKANTVFETLTLIQESDEKASPKLEDNNTNTAYVEVNVSQESDEKTSPKLEDNNTNTAYVEVNVSQESGEKVSSSMEYSPLEKQGASENLILKKQISISLMEQDDKKAEEIVPPHVVPEVVENSCELLISNNQEPVKPADKNKVHFATNEDLHDKSLQTSSTGNNAENTFNPETQTNDDIELQKDDNDVSIAQSEDIVLQEKTLQVNNDVLNSLSKEESLQKSQSSVTKTNESNSEDRVGQNSEDTLKILKKTDENTESETQEAKQESFNQESKVSSQEPSNVSIKNGLDETARSVIVHKEEKQRKLSIPSTEYNEEVINNLLNDSLSTCTSSEVPTFSPKSLRFETAESKEEDVKDKEPLKKRSAEVGEDKSAKKSQEPLKTIQFKNATTDINFLKALSILLHNFKKENEFKNFYKDLYLQYILTKKISGFFKLKRSFQKKDRRVQMYGSNPPDDLKESLDSRILMLKFIELREAIDKNLEIYKKNEGKKLSSLKDYKIDGIGKFECHDKYFGDDFIKYNVLVGKEEVSICEYVILWLLEYARENHFSKIKKN